jgi:hypothetical protein
VAIFGSPSTRAFGIATPLFVKKNVNVRTKKKNENDRE